MKPAVLFPLLIAVSVSFGQSTFHGNYARTGVYDSAGPKQTPNVLWTFKSSGPIVSSPTIALQ